MHRAAFILAVTLSAWTATARATTVGIVRPVHASPLTAEVLIRLFGEVRSLGLEPRMLEVMDSAQARGAAAPLHLQALADERGVDAVIALPGSPAPRAVEVWAADRNGRSVARRVAIESDIDGAPQTIAIRAIELLRSCLLEIDLIADATTSVTAPAPAAPPSLAVGEGEGVVAGSPAQRLGLGAGLVVVVSVDGVGPAVLPSLGLAWKLTPAWSVDAELAGEGTRGSVEGAAGSARVAHDHGVLGIRYRALADHRLRPLGGLSAGALRTGVDGQGLPSYDSHRVARWSFLVDGAAGASLRLGARWELVAALHLQLAAPYPAVRFVGQTVATTARPNVLLGLAMEVWL